MESLPTPDQPARFLYAHIYTALENVPLALQMEEDREHKERVLEDSEFVDSIGVLARHDISLPLRISLTWDSYFARRSFPEPVCPAEDVATIQLHYANHIKLYAFVQKQSGMVVAEKDIQPDSEFNFEIWAQFTDEETSPEISMRELKVLTELLKAITTT